MRCRVIGQRYLNVRRVAIHRTLILVLTIRRQSGSGSLEVRYLHIFMSIQSSRRHGYGNGSTSNLCYQGMSHTSTTDKCFGVFKGMAALHFVYRHLDFRRCEIVDLFVEMRPSGPRRALSHRKNKTNFFCERTFGAEV